MEVDLFNEYLFYFKKRKIYDSFLNTILIVMSVKQKENNCSTRFDKLREGKYSFFINSCDENRRFSRNTSVD